MFGRTRQTEQCVAGKFPYIGPQGVFTHNEIQPLLFSQLFSIVLMVTG